jgi:hypothetical protein
MPVGATFYAKNLDEAVIRAQQQQQRQKQEQSQPPQQ